jgi:VRR-NUC domain
MSRRTIPPLLMLAEGKKPRARKAVVPMQKESALHAAVADTLRRFIRDGWIWWHCPNGGSRDIREAARFKRLGVTAGIPDLQLLSPKGKPHFIELKRHGESLSEAQIEFRDWCFEHDVPHCTAFDIAEAIGALSGWGAQRIRIARGAS